MVAVLETVIELINVSGGGDCILSNYGSMRDVISPIDYKLKPGIYIFEGECATGGWALSTLLTGQNKLSSGSISINDRELQQIQLQRIGCYVGQEPKIKKWFGTTEMTVSEQIFYGVSHGLSYSNSVLYIKNIFHLSDERFNRKWKYISGERWRASIAVGYAMGKSIYCFPWMNSNTVVKLNSILLDCIPPLIDVGAIILMPTTDYQRVSNVFEKYNPIIFGNT